MTRGNKFAIVALVIALAAMIAGGFYLSGALSGSGGYGTLNTMVHDQPCSTCTHAWVTISAVSAHESNVSGNGWTTLNVSGTTFDMMALNGSSMAKTLGLLTLKAGHYEQVRITVINVTVGVTGGTKIVATVEGPTADLDSQFTIASGATTTLNLDIDLSTSLHMVDVNGTMTATFTPHIGTVTVTGP